MTPEAKELWKSIGRLIGHCSADVARDFANMVTCIPRNILENHIDNQVQKKIMERQFPHLSRLPRKQQLWSELRLGASEDEVGTLLGLPSEVTVIDIQEMRENNYEYKFDERWTYAFMPKFSAVYFKNKIVVAFEYRSTPDEIVKKGFPLEITPPVPEPTSPCPYCGKELRTPLAKQCFSCHMDWHNPNNVIKHNVNR